ncbi:hypothetical protein [Pantoea ananatis]|uniref:hypothetical protein n=1 Tax=Pantoea ananas TaxID=553 RepID=UPI000D5D4B90|nr:hypothetical protein [Pantoea ananatis]PVY80213.1 hypothetical protein C7427_11820 [Pantoea ananatis]
MTEAKGFIELFLSHGWPVLIAFVSYHTVNMVFGWLGRSEPAGLLKALFNRRRQHLEKMLIQPYLARETRKLARAELNQLSRRKLTGFSDPRLQEALTCLCLHHNLPSRYFLRWRTYLSVKSGRIVFARRWYRLAWRFFVFFNLPVSTCYTGFLFYLVAHQYDFLTAGFIMGLLLAVFYVPWLAMTVPMGPWPTKEMENYVNVYNASLEETK